MTGINPTTIQWVHPDPARRFTSNPVWGCTHGCPYCYGRSMAQRYKWPDFTQLRYYPDRLKAMAKALARREENCGVFLLSMSDPGNKEVHPAWLDRILETVRDLPQHTFYLLTKNPRWLGSTLRLVGRGEVPYLENLVLGVTVESRATAWRTEDLLSFWSGRTMLSYEPILGPPPNIDPSLDWVVMGGLSPQTRWLPEGWSSMHSLHEASAVWAREMIDQARAAHIPVFIKTHPAEIPGLPMIQEWPAGWVVHPAPKHQPSQDSAKTEQLGLF